MFHLPKRKILGILLSLAAFHTLAQAADFGTVVPVRGLTSDLALDPRRGKVYAANLGARRVEVIDVATRTMEFPMFVPLPPSSVALSPDGRFLAAGQYDNFEDPEQATKGALTIFDLDAHQQRDLTFSSPVLAVEFGAGNSVFVVTTTQFLLVEPLSGNSNSIPAEPLLAGSELPIPFVTFSAEIIQAATGVSGDGQVIVVLAQIDADDPNTSAVVFYHVGADVVSSAGFIAEPPLGPRAVSVDQTGKTFILGWGMFDLEFGVAAQFPYPTGDFQNGGHAWDHRRNTIYANIPVELGERPVLHVMDTDNLTVRERIQIPQTFSGSGLIMPDGNTLITLSEGGVLFLPLNDLETAPKVLASREDVLFLPGQAIDGVVTHSFEITSPAGREVDFRLSLPQTSGVRLSQTSGRTPATISVEVDLAAFVNARGTTTIPLTLESNEAVNLPPAIRLLVNNALETSRGRIVNVPGKLVDVLADPARSRFYVIRQDKNLVLVFNDSTMQQIASLRTGNTPTSLAVTEDQRYLLVGNDNSQYISVFDLDTLAPSAPIRVPGAYPRSVAVGVQGAIWTTARQVADPGLSCNGPDVENPMYRVNFAQRIALAPPRLGVFCNEVPPDSALRSSPSGFSMVVAMPDGSAALWDGQVLDGGQWVISRDNLPVGGAFGALSDSFIVLDDQILDQSILPTAQFTDGTGASSGVALLQGRGLRSTAGAANAPGTLMRIDLGLRQSTHPTSIVEAPMVAATLQTPPVGQIGQTILPFLRTMAVAANQSTIALLTQSGLTLVPSNYDDPSTLPPPPDPVVVSSVVNAADGGPNVAPGGLIVIRGTGMASGSATAPGAPLPFLLGGTRVTANGVPLPLLRVSPTEIGAQLPFHVSGSVSLVVRTARAQSEPFTLTVQTAAPAIFQTGAPGDERRLATVIRSRNNDFVTFTNPVHPNDVLTIYLTGMGQVTPPVEAGIAAPSDPLSQVVTAPVITIGGVQLNVLYAGLAPGTVGVYQINAAVPDNIQSNAQTELVISQGGFSVSLQVRVVAP